MSVQCGNSIIEGDGKFAQGLPSLQGRRNGQRDPAAQAAEKQYGTWSEKIEQQ